MKLWLATHREHNQDRSDYHEDHLVHEDLVELLKELDSSLVAEGFPKGKYKLPGAELLREMALAMDQQTWKVTYASLGITVELWRLDTAERMWFGDLTRGE